LILTTKDCEIDNSQKEGLMGGDEIDNRVASTLCKTKVITMGERRGVLIHIWKKLAEKKKKGLITLFYLGKNYKT